MSIIWREEVGRRNTNYMGIDSSVRKLNIMLLTNVVLLLMVFGLFTIDNRAVLNLASVAMVLLSLYTIRSEKINIIKAIGNFFKNRKSLAIFSLWCLICIVFFTYKNNTAGAVGQFFKDWRYPIIMLVFFIAFHKHILQLKKTYVISAIITLAYIVLVVPVLRYIKNDPQALYLQLRYGFAFYVVMLYPFVLAGGLMYKNILIKISLLSLSFLAFIFLLYTGSRGGILSLAVETVAVMFLCTKNIKKFLLVIFMSLAVAGIGVAIAYNSFSQVKNKVDQSTQVTNISSGRDQIITQRYPLVMNSIKNAIFGIGYGNSTYDEYLWDHQAPRNNLVFNFNTNKYNLDEPLFFTILYNIGFGGLALFLVSVFVNIKEMIKSVRAKRDIFSISLLTSFIGYFLVYCLFEKMFMEIYLLYTIMALVFINKKGQQDNMETID